MLAIRIDDYPGLKVAAFATEFPGPLGQVGSPTWLVDLLRLDVEAPVSRSEELRVAVRDLLRQRGYKPTGRGKPASEYLVRAAEQGTLRSINAAVDACNAVSLHSGLPISVVDLDKTTPPYVIKPGEPGARYVFNPAGQEIDVAGLLCLYDAAGPCANAVKDAQRTKTDDDTMRTLTIIWGLESQANALRSALAWYQTLLKRLHCTIDIISNDG